MFSTNQSYLRTGLMNAGVLAASLLTAATLALGVSAAFAPKASAAEIETAASEESGRYVRMGLNKSVVVRLPAEARDVIVGNNDIVDVVVRSKNTAYLFARKTGQTNVFFFDRAGQQILALDLEVAMDVTAVRKLLQRSLPGTRITVDTVNSNVILGGTAKNALEAKTAVDLATQFATPGTPLVNTIKLLGEDQVMLKVKVVEIQRDVIKQFGINFTALLEMGNFAFNLSSVNPFANALISPNGGYKAAYQNGGNQVEGLIRAMESDGLVRTLAEPNLTALTGQSAKFRAGGEYPFQSCAGTTGNLTCSTEWKEYGVAVDFTPVVLDGGRINLTIATNVSDLGTVVNGQQSINKRDATTVLELPSGGTMMIAGLISENTRQNIGGTPGLKKLPVLGSLFRSRDFVSNETELVIFVTPYLVRPTSEKQLVTPDKGFNPPTDRQAIFLGRLNKVYGRGGKTPQGKYNGNIGFIVE